MEKPILVSLSLAIGLPHAAISQQSPADQRAVWDFTGDCREMWEREEVQQHLDTCSIFKLAGMTTLASGF